MNPLRNFRYYFPLKSEEILLFRILNPPHFFYLKNKIKIDDEKIKKHINIIEKDLFKARRILEDLLSYLRRRPPVLRMENLEKLINEVVEKFEGVNINIQFERYGDSFLKEVDRCEFEQVIDNIISNSIEAGAGNIFIRLKKENSKVIIEIEDDGKGMNEEEIKNIFQPFYSGKEGGTGLGLSVCKKIIEERHNGEIKIESFPGKGTKVKIVL